MSDRQSVSKSIQTTPDAAAHTELPNELEMLASIREGLAQSERGEGVPHEQVVAMLLTRRTPGAESTVWCELLRQTQGLPAVGALTDADIAAEVATIRASR